MTGKYAADPDGITLYALSTCIWCRKTRRLLDRLGITYRLIEVDMLEGQDKIEAFTEVHRWSTTGSFPVLVINARTVIQGCKEDRIIRELGG